MTRAGYEVAAKTANYSVLGSDNGGVLTNRGAGGSVTFTLPDPQPGTGTTTGTAIGNVGMAVKFFVVADQTVVVTATSANKLTVFNNATATSISWATGSQKIGSGCEAISDGTTWLITLFPGTTSAAQTAATVTIA